MRVVTLLPAATEIVAALGAADWLVGVSHECDYPPGVERLPRVTATPINISAPGAVIDAELRRLLDAGQPVIGLDAAQLALLEPDLLITQGLCDVCAIDSGEVLREVTTLRSALGRTRVLSLNAHDVAGIAADVRTVGKALGLDARAAEVGSELTSVVREMRPNPGIDRPRVLCIEWLDPLYLAGHWVPELVTAAGGEDVGARPGQRSARHSWRRVAALQPDLIMVLLCGFGVPRALTELAALADPEALALMERVPTWVVDGNAFTSRPGPRVVEGARQIRRAIEGAGHAHGPVRWIPEHARSA
ncbi:MAG: ABC transporter substrate-binding protein [Gemmatimonadales bacterium]|nr:ABC transporter substrate-binding protein [Gemmatimonadales bacterium]